MGEQETTKRKIVILILLPLLIMSFLSVGYSQTVSDTSIISMSGANWSLKVDSALASSIDSRNTPYMTAKSSTEKELFLELASLEDCKSGVVQFKVDMAGLTAYKQLPLTEQEIAEGSFRPKNVENSFALFDDSGRKVAHIYGSKITDSKGVEVWLDQDLAGGLLTVYLPKAEVLGTLSFPVLLDPTFGYTSVGGSSYAVAGAYNFGFNYTLTEDAYVYAITAYLSDGNDVDDLSFGIYNEVGARLGYTSLGVMPSLASWVSINFSSPLSVTSGNRPLSINSEAYNGWKFYFDTGGANTWGSGQSATPYGVSQLTNEVGDQGWKVSIYANYTIEEEPTPTPSPTPSPSPTAGASATPFPEGAMDDTDWWISILVVVLIIINIFLMMLPFALVRFTFGILSLFLCMLALSYQVPLSPYLQTAGLLISALAMLFSVRARE